MKRYLILFVVFAVICFAQVQPQITGAGAPANPCVNPGQQYFDTTNRVTYNCSVPGQNWVNLGIGNITGSGTPSTTCQPGPFVAQTDAATVTWSISNYICSNASLTFTVHGGSRTLNVTGLVNGGSYVLKLVQDATGGESLTGGTGCTWKQVGGGGSTFTLTGTASAIDMLSFVFDGTNCIAILNKNAS